jgi:hypothetical protein
VWEQGATGRFALEDTLVLDTPAWSAWLDDPGTRSFAFPVYDPVHGYIAGFMTVRKEPRQRGGVYWSAYWRVGGQVRKASLCGRLRRCDGSAPAGDRAHLGDAGRDGPEHR